MNHEQDIIERLDRIEKTLNGTKERPLTLEETAAYLGISKSYLYKLTSKSRIPHYKPEGKKVYFEKSELDTWLLRNRVATTQEISTEATRRVLESNRKTRELTIRGKGGTTERSSRP